MQRFTDLKVWQCAHAWVLSVYRASASFPREELFGLTSQLRRAAAAVTANIVEGSKRQSRGDYARFLNIAESSLAEAEYFLILARDLDYLQANAAIEQLATVAEIARMLHGLRVSVQRA